MSIANPFEITYGSQSVGGTSSTYQLAGPYVIDKSYDGIRLAFDVVVVAGSMLGLQSASETLEDAFRERLTDGDTLKISLSGNLWTYTVGQTILKVRSSITKSGNPETDRGYSRAYTISIEGELPADASSDAGLRDIEVLVDYDSSRRRSVTMRGTYTATTSGSAKDNYTSNGDGVASDYLDAVDSSATFELVDESYTLDREGTSGSPDPHVLNWMRQYVELLANQVAGTLDDAQIKDHRITFTDLHQYPGDSDRDADRLRRVVGNYDCAVDVEASSDLTGIYNNKVRDHIRALFVSNFDPAEFAIEEERVSIDPTANRISSMVQFVYRKTSGEKIVEVSQSVAYRENRTILYTPTHEPNEFSYDVDLGFATLERIWNRTVIALGQVAPKTRIIERAKQDGDIGRFDGQILGVSGPDGQDTSKVNREGWNVIASVSQAEPRFLGDPSDPERIELTALTETVVERWHKKPGGRTSVPIPGGGGGVTGGSSGPITQGGS